MRKYISLLAIITILIPTTSSATLYEYYNEQNLNLPTVSDRAPLAVSCGVVDYEYQYSGSQTQNDKLESCLRGLDGLLGANPLPSDDYDTYLTAPLSTNTTTVYVNELPSGVSSSIYTIFASDGVTPREKLYCTGTASSPNRLTGCTRGISFSPVSGVIRESSGTGLTHSKNARIAITDNVNFSGKALAILNGSQETGSDTFLVSTTSTSGIRLEGADRRLTAFNNSSNPFVRYNTSTGRWQFSDDGTNTTNFATSSAAGLSASSSKGIFVTDSLIGVNVSSTGGLTTTPTGLLSVLYNGTSGITSSMSGLAVNTSTNFTFAGTLDITTTTNLLFATSSQVANLVPRMNASGTLDNFITATTSFPFFPNTLTNENTYYTSILPMIPIGVSTFADALGWSGFENSGTAATKFRGANMASTTFSTAEAWAAPIVGTSTQYAQFGEGNELRIKFRARAVLASATDVNIGLATAVTNFNDVSSTNSNRVTFVFSSANVGSLTSNGSAITKNTITGIDTTVFHTYEIVLTNAAVQFWVDGVLRFTHTSNIPTSGIVRFGAGNNTNGSMRIWLTDPVITQKL